ncbi:MAG: GGDEF domain-containing protein [Cytophaga sp.]|nr:GGDEF domain-containing protein [Undibacterium sp.]
MFFSRNKQTSANSDFFPLTDTLMDFDETMPARPASGEPKPRRQSEYRTKSSKRTISEKWMIAGTLIGLYFLANFLFYEIGLTRKSTIFTLVGLIAFGLLAFFAAFETKLNTQLREKRLKLPIVIVAFSYMLFIFYLEPATQIIFTPFAFISIAYGMYRIRTNTIYIIVGFALLGFGLVIFLHYRQWTNLALLKLEVMHFLVLILSLPAFVFQIGKVQFLNRTLHRASRKIKYIQEDAKRDVLIDCFNRRYMVAALEEQKQRADEDGTSLCLAVIDLDHFKKINDELGHLGGDEVLRTFSRIAQENIRSEDIFGRYGGEEFLLIFPTTSLLPALNTSERIRGQVEHFPWDGALQHGVSVSIGVTQYIPGESVLELFSRADTAMYLAKQGGRNQVVVEEPVLGKNDPESLPALSEAVMPERDMRFGMNRP